MADVLVSGALYITEPKLAVVLPDGGLKGFKLGLVIRCMRFVLSWRGSAMAVLDAFSSSKSTAEL